MATALCVRHESGIPTALFCFLASCGTASLANLAPPLPCATKACMRCDPSAAAPPAVPVMLAGSPLPSQGRLLVYKDVDGLWAPVSSKSNLTPLVSVVCKQLGYASGIASVLNTYDPPGDNSLRIIDCLGTEASISSCTFSGWNDRLDGYEEVDVVCAAAGGVATRLCCDGCVSW